MKIPFVRDSNVFPNSFLPQESHLDVLEIKSPNP